MNLDDFAIDPTLDPRANAELDPRPKTQRCEICLKLGVGNGALADLGDCPICKRYTRLNATGTCGREYCSRLWKRQKREARRD